MVEFSGQIIRLLFLSGLSFLLAFILSPIFIRFFRHRNLGKQIRNAARAPIMSAMHQAKKGTPTMAGMIIWLTALILVLVFWKTPFNFLTRSQTLLPLGALIASALVGLVDDWLNIKKHDGLRMRHRLLIYTAIAVFAAGWFYFKLDWDTLRVPFVGDFYIGAWYIPIFIFIIVATSFSVNEADGLDGLAGGVLLSSFVAFGLISFLQGKYDLAVFCGILAGALFAFLWFNVFPAAFFMGDTGAMSLGVTLGIVAMLSNAVLLLPVIGFILVLESLSVILQIGWRKILKRKLFLSTPLHHHLQAKGWPEPKIVMRLWILSMQFAGLGVIFFLLDQFLRSQ